MDDQGKKLVIRQLPGLGIGGGGLRGVDILKAKAKYTEMKLLNETTEMTFYACASTYEPAVGK